MNIMIEIASLLMADSGKTDSMKMPTHTVRISRINAHAMPFNNSIMIQASIVIKTLPIALNTNIRLNPLSYHQKKKNGKGSGINKMPKKLSAK